MIKKFDKFNESDNNIDVDVIKKANTKILYDIDIVVGILEDLKDLGYSPSSALTIGDRRFGVEGAEVYIKENINKLIPTINTNILSGPGNASENDLVSIIELLKSRLESFTDCRINETFISFEKKIRESYRKGELKPLQTRMSSNLMISFSNFKNRYNSIIK